MVEASAEKAAVFYKESVDRIGDEVVPDDVLTKYLKERGYKIVKVSTH